MISEFSNEHRFLSNFHYCKVNYKGIQYPTSEHAYQAAKTDDIKQKLYISKLKTPCEAKRKGQKVKLISDWDNVKIDIMKEIVKAKFEQNIHLKQQLINTGSEYLIEGNYWGDHFWGVCEDIGKNWLGIILMEVRKELA